VKTKGTHRHDFDPLFPSFGVSIPVYVTPLLLETEEYQETETLTFWQRWIEPVSTFLNFQTMPFEPWVKTRTVIKTRQFPSRKILRTQMGLFMHPVMKREFSVIIGNVTE
jgi:hypothetical protein